MLVPPCYNPYKAYFDARARPNSSIFIYSLLSDSIRFSIICFSKHLGIFNAFTISITIKAGKFPGEIFHKRKFFLPYRREELYGKKGYFINGISVG